MSLQRPETVEELIAHCKMKIGEPVIRVNVTEDQARACVYEAVDKFTEYHDEASDEGIFVQEIDQQVKDDQGFEVPDSVTAVLEVMGVTGSGNQESIIQGGGEVYTLGMSHVGHNYMIGGVNDKVSMFLAQRDLSYLRNVLRPPPVYRFNQSTKFLAIEEPADRFEIGQNIMYRATFSLEDLPSRFWRDVWLIKYTTALIKLQWASNISKYQNVTLPGGYTLNGSDLKSEAKDEKKELEDELYDTAAVMRTVMSVG